MNQVGRVMNIRPAGTEDIPIIRDIAQRTWPVAYREILSPVQLAYMLELMYSEAALYDQILMQGHHFILALAEHGAIGFAGYEHDHRHSGHTRLHKLYVAPEVQGAGAGKTMLQAVCDAACDVGDHAIELCVNRHNPALQFYLLQGFNIIRDEVTEIGLGFVMDDHVLVRPIGLTEHI